MREIKIRALKVHQPIGDFFIGVISHKDLNEICFTDVREIGQDGELDSYIGIQRHVDKKRINDIKQYVRTPDATFPTSIILSVDENCAEWDEANSTLTLKEFIDDTCSERSIYFNSIAKIIDGQHRVMGLSEGNNYQLEYEDDGEKLDFDLNVSVFVGADIAEQATIFATVNLAQTKVNKSLVYDLAELSKTRSPQQTAHNIAVALDKNEKSPLYSLIKRLGTATPGRAGETLTQATVVEALLSLISKNPNLDRHILKKGGRLPKPNGLDQTKYIFRQLFIEEKDSDIAKIIWSYFAAIREQWPQSWNDSSKGNIIRKTNGFRAFMRYLPTIYLYISGSDTTKLVNKESFLEVLSKSNIRDGSFTIENFPPGSSGESILLKKLSEIEF